MNYPTYPQSLGELWDRQPSLDKTPKQQLFPLAPGRSGVFQTAELMAQCVRGEVPPDFAGYQSAAVQAIANEVAGLFIGQTFQQAAFHYVQFCIEYLAHPFDQQVVQDAIVTAATGQGDCVSMSVLVATLLASKDIPVWFVLQDPTGNEYSHVYCETLIDGKIIALDAVAKGELMGWRQPLTENGFETTWLIF